MQYQTIRINEHGDQLTIEILEKRIYLTVTDIFAEEINEVLKKNFSDVVIDMQHVSVMNSSGIGVLIKMRDEITKSGRSISLKNLQPLMSDIFSRMRLDTLFDIQG
ncbi:STAS domain-containing protein [candidate division KSB1 bacterium]|nr:STAS domain-containing protein [candidate division KSB1 bacterium]